jgi:archaellum component FlaC
MEYSEINSIMEELDKSIDKQINLISDQINELKSHMATVEKLLEQIKTK